MAGKNPQRILNKATRAHQGGDYKTAERLYRKLLKDFPQQPKLHFWLGSSLARQGKPQAAIRSIETSLTFDPNDHEALNALGSAYHDLGDFHTAIGYFQRALARLPDYPEALNNLGAALKEIDQRQESAQCFQKALTLAPEMAGAAYNLASVVLNDRNLEPAADALEHAINTQPDFFRAHFHLGVVRYLQGDTDAAKRHFDKARQGKDCGPLLESWDYIKDKIDAGARLFGETFETLGFAIDHATVPGLTLEFGVSFGASLRFIARRVPGLVHGFDSFEGLPENWGAEKAGQYSTAGVIPDMPENVRLHVGWFDNTLAPFAAKNLGPVRLANVDCDLYGSTRTIFENLGDRIVRGTVLVFDEYLAYAGWHEGEFKAFQEFVSERGLAYQYLAFSLFSKQAVVKIL